MTVSKHVVDGASKPHVLVMMATYNGVKYLAEQIDSILAQKGVDISLRICDDQSTDTTALVASEYTSKHDNIVFTVNSKNLGVGENFMQMVYEDSAIGYDYYAFSDQDDVWLPEKLSKAIEAIVKLTETNSAAPVLYYSDYENVDENLGNPRREKCVYKKCIHSYTPLLSNWAPGCTMVFNPSLFNRIREYRPTSWPRIHDGWTYLVCCYCGGQIVHDLDNAYIKRRISSNNVVGEGKYHIGLKEAKVHLDNLRNRPSSHYASHAAQMLLTGYSKKGYISQKDLPILQDVAQLDRSLGKRIKLVFSHDFVLPNIQMEFKSRLQILLGRC